jgi:hypothetical protein
VWRSQLFRKPPCASAPLSDPGPVSTPVACVPFGVRLTVGVSILSPLAKTGRPGRLNVFRDSITRLMHSLHTLRASLAVTLRNGRFRVAANLSRVGLVTHWVSLTCLFILSFASSCTVCWRDLPNVQIGVIRAAGCEDLKSGSFYQNHHNDGEGCWGEGAALSPLFPPYDFRARVPKPLRPGSAGIQRYAFRALTS